MKIKTNIEMIKREDLIPYSNNPKQHPEEQVKKIANSIQEYGFTVPLVVNQDNTIIAGHGRYKAAKLLDLDELPCIKRSDLIDAQIKAFRIADNRIAESEWDEELLETELEGLEEMDYDLDLTGFDSSFLNSLGEEEVEEDNYEEEKPEDPDAREGDIYKLGDHRVMCGDATKEEDVKALMDGNKADMVFTDPPYNVDYGGKNPQGWSKRNDIAGDKQTAEEWAEFNSSLQNIIKKYTQESCDIYLCGAPGPDGIWQRNNWINNGLHWSSTIIWVKDQFVFSRSNYHRRYEPILYGWFGKSSYNGDATKDEVWEVERPHESKEHPTMKPIKLITKGIKNSSLKQNIVMDLFGGSGSTLIACEQLDRKCYMMELDPHYIDVIIDRWEEFTGKSAELIKNVKD